VISYGSADKIYTKGKERRGPVGIVAQRVNARDLRTREADMSERRSPERTFSGPRSLLPSLSLSLSLSLCLLVSKIFLIYEYYPLLRVAPGAIIKRDGRACVIADIRPRDVRGGRGGGRGKDGEEGRRSRGSGRLLETVST